MVCDELFAQLEVRRRQIAELKYTKQFDLYDRLPRPITRMRIRRFSRTVWVYVGSDSWGAAPLDREVFLDKVRHKRELARLYAYDAEELWLIFYNEWGAHADYYLFPHESYYRPLEMDPFDRVVLYSVKDNLVYEFPTLNKLAPTKELDNF